MIKYILICDKPINGLQTRSDTLLTTPTDFIANKTNIDLRKKSLVKVINLCSSYEYLSKGYYCSLLAEARGLRCIPSVSNIVTLQWKRNYQSFLPELNDILDKTMKGEDDEPSLRQYTIYFGRCKEQKLDTLARRLFDLFRFPLMAVEIKYSSKGKWVVQGLEPLSIHDIPAEKHSRFINYLDIFTGQSWRNKEEKREKYWIGVLHNPTEDHPPSNKAALKKFAAAGKKLGLFIEMITKDDYASLLEYDALFIRETTAINHHTFRFALKAREENIPCVDDAPSIIRCCNKVFQFEILEANKVPLPKTIIIDKKSAEKKTAGIGFPCVVKIPDGAFSKGILKADNQEELNAHIASLLKKSEIIIAQEFVRSDFDWRIGIINNVPIFACKYYMAKGHWQIYNHNQKAKNKHEGDHMTVAVEDVPKPVMDMALKAAGHIGSGLYGVDLKETADGQIVVMEVNDNPNIDSGVEDQILGDKLYEMILKSLIEKIESR